MNIKQVMDTIVMPFKKSESRLRKNYERACRRGYCPTTKEIENSAIKQLANRLKTASDKETLTNLLEWQNRNIVFWFERFPLSIILLLLAFLSVCFTNLFLALRNIPTLSWLVVTLSWLVVILGTTTATTLAITILMICYSRGIPLKQLVNIFKDSIPLNSLLENKLSVCRDYAKLTACLLFNIYPDAEVYFAHAPQHVATGTLIENKLYMLDKQLPIVTIDKWHERWHTHRYSKKTMEKVKGNYLEKVDINSFLSSSKSTEPSTEKLATDMIKLLNIEEQTSEADLLSMEILRWKKGAILYEDNEIVNYSLARRLKMKISSEVIKINKIARIEVERRKDDLVFLIRFSLE